MADRAGNRQSGKTNAGRRLLVGVGASAGVFLAAAAMATGSAVTAAPAHADFEDLLDPIIQPILTSLTDSLTAVDPAAAVDLTSWTDSLLSSLSSVDLALPASAESSSALAAAAEPAASSTAGTYDIPITIEEDTEATVTATVDGSSTTDLIDTGSSGLVIPSTDLGSNFLTQLESLLELGVPTGIGESGYSSGVDYIYLTYDNVSVDYTGGLDTTAPVEVEIYSWDPDDLSSLFTDDAFQDFLSDNDVTGILGVGDDISGSAGESPLEAAGFSDVTVDESAGALLVGDSAPTDYLAVLTANGSTVDGLTETITNGAGTVLGTGTVDDDLDSGGVYGTIPESITGSSDTVPAGDTITVYNGTQELYSYTVGTDSDGTSTAPTAVDSTDIDSGVIPFEEYPVTIDYSSGDIYIGGTT